MQGTTKTPENKIVAMIGAMIVLDGSRALLTDLKTHRPSDRHQYCNELTKQQLAMSAVKDAHIVHSCWFVVHLYDIVLFCQEAHKHDSPDAREAVDGESARRVVDLYKYNAYNFQDTLDCNPCANKHKCPITFSHSRRTSPYTEHGAANIPQMIAAQGSTTEQPAVIATRPKCRGLRLKGVALMK